MADAAQKMSRLQLTGMVVGGMVGAGLFSLPLTFANATGRLVAAIVVASIGIWLFPFLILCGVKQAAFINSVVTFAKVIAIVVFIVMLVLCERAHGRWARNSGAGAAAAIA